MRSHACLFSLTVFTLVAVPAVGFSQDQKGQTHAMKGDVPGPIHRRLNDLAGTWDVALQYELGMTHTRRQS